MTEHSLNDELGAVPCAVEYDDWPEMGFEIDDVQVARAEPDVGIMSDYVEDFTFTGWVNRETFSDRDAFARAICSAIAAEQGGFDQVVKILDRALSNAADAMLESDIGDL